MAVNDFAQNQQFSQLDFIAYQGKKKRSVLVDVPDLQNAPLVETHAHLDMLENPSLALARAAQVGITHIVTLANLSRSEQTFEMIDVWQEGAQNILDEAGSSAVLPHTVIAAGVHPHDAQHYTSQIESRLVKLAHADKIAAIGEAGLDYYYDHSPREVQRAVFIRNLELAHDLDLPVIIHLRDAHDDGLRIIEQTGIPDAGAILHCYNRGLETAQPFLDLGAVLGFGGPITFNSAKDLKAAAATVPANSFVLETDCPFMAPTPFRGQKCEPAHTLWVAAELAALRAQTLPDLANQTSQLAAELFGLKLPQIRD